MADWNPELYNRFRDYRAEPFNWILHRLPLSDKESIADLGCGTGENTVKLARRCPEGVVTGIDSSPAMLARAQELRRRLPPDLASRISFIQADFRQLESDREYSIIVSNAALQWASDHREVLSHWYRALRPEGRMVVQMPANHHETAQLTLSELARESRWRSTLGDVAVPSHRVSAPEDYREMLAALGFEAIDCYYHIFQHPMESAAAIVEFCRSTTLRPFMERLAPEQQPAFVEEFTHRLEQAYGTSGPLTFNFRRLFLWARRPVRD